MPRKTAPPKVTGGGGFSYASKVTAYLLSSLLTNAPPFHREWGTIERLDLETKEGWLFDDARLVLSAQQGQRQVAISIKSYVQINSNGASEDLVRDLWEQFLDPVRTGFDRNRDKLCAVMAPL